ncbi:MAG: cyclodeaminase/cyclohydrolase family protein [Candidatus Omnitrophota bacterium]
MYRNKTLKKYADDLAARSPTPGGGSAAALVAALGVSLVSMVVNFTLGRKEYAAYESELKEMLVESEKLRGEFLNLVDLDIAAYKSRNIRDALDIPFMLCRLCFEGMKLCPALVKKGNPRLISDVAVAAVLLESAFTSAYFNVLINLRCLKGEKVFCRRLLGELKRKDKLIRGIRLKTEARVGEIIRR